MAGRTIDPADAPYVDSEPADALQRAAGHFALRHEPHVRAAMARAA